jgi:hypothetical protein
MMLVPTRGVLRQSWGKKAQSSQSSININGEPPYATKNIYAHNCRGMHRFSGAGVLGARSVSI